MSTMDQDGDVTMLDEVSNGHGNEEFSLVDEDGVKSSEFLTKQQIITHVIDGFVIEESLSPFLSGVNCGLSNHQLSLIRMRQQDILKREKDVKCEEEHFFSDKQDNAEIIISTCEQCGFSGPRAKFSKPTKRFCSLLCARKYKSRFAGNVQTYTGMKSPRLINTVARRGKPRLRSHSISNKSSPDGGNHVNQMENDLLSSSQSLSDNSFSDDDKCSCSSSSESVFSRSPSPLPQPTIPYNGDTPVHPRRWTVEDVWNYMRSLPDTMQYAADFKAQEIDGSALLLLQEEHLVSSMNFPLGPALKLCAHIDRLRENEML